MKNEYIRIGEYKFTIKNKHDKWHLDFYHNDKRVKRSSKLAATKKNLRHLEYEVLPELVEQLTGESIHLIEEETLEKDLTLDEYAKIFFKSYQLEIRKHTFHRNKLHYKRQIKPNFGKMLLKDIKPIMLQTWVGKMKKRYTINTIKTYFSILNLILRSATLNEYMPVNPADSLRGIFKKSGFIKGYDIFPLTSNEIEMIKDTDIIKPYVKNFLLISYYSGARPGELLALTWDDIDFENRYIQINKTLVRGVVGDTKTVNSVRKIDLFDDTIEVLKKQYEISGNKKNVFITQYKKPYKSSDVIGLTFRKCLKKLKIKERNLYQLRHTYASTLISKGIDIIYVSKMMGHASPNITLTRYARFIEKDEEERLQNISNISALI